MSYAPCKNLAGNTKVSSFILLAYDLFMIWEAQKYCSCIL